MPLLLFVQITCVSFIFFFLLIFTPQIRTFYVSVWTVIKSSVKVVQSVTAQQCLLACLSLTGSTFKTSSSVIHQKRPADHMPPGVCSPQGRPPWSLAVSRRKPYCSGSLEGKHWQPEISKNNPITCNSDIWYLVLFSPVLIQSFKILFVFIVPVSRKGQIDCVVQHLSISSG